MSGNQFDVLDSATFMRMAWRHAADVFQESWNSRDASMVEVVEPPFARACEAGEAMAVQIGMVLDDPKLALTDEQRARVPAVVERALRDFTEQQPDAS